MSTRVRLLFLLFGAGIVSFLIWRVGVGTIADMLRGVGWAFLWVTLIYAAHVVVRAVALWRSLVATPVPFRDVLRIRLSGEAVEMLTFTGPVLAEPAKAMLLKQRGLDSANAFGGVSVEYLLYNAVAFWLTGVSAAILLATSGLGAGFQRPIFIVLLAVVLLTAAVVYAAARRIVLVAPAVRLVTRALGLNTHADRAADSVAPVEAVLVGFMHEEPGRLLEVLAIELFGHALLASEIWIVLSTLGLRPSLTTPITFEGAIKPIGLIFFFIPGQFGGSESVYTFLAEAMGFGAAAGLTIALVRRIRALIVAAGGLLVLSTLRFNEPADV